MSATRLAAADYAQNNDNVNGGIAAYEDAFDKAGIKYEVHIYEGTQHALNSDASAPKQGGRRPHLEPHGRASVGVWLQFSKPRKGKATQMMRINRPYVGIPTFLRSRHEPEIDALKAMVAVLGVPFDEGSPFLPGSRMGPRALREQSLRFAGRPGFHDIATGLDYLREEVEGGLIADIGDVDVHPTNPERTFAGQTDMVRAAIGAGAMPVVLGGDHSITFATVRAFAEPIHIIQFDAHTDYAPITDALRFTNGHAFRHIAAMSHVTGITQVGIRSLRTSPEQLADIRRDGHRIATVEHFRTAGVEKILAHLPTGTRCFVSIDVDVLDMPLVPGCVSAEPDGLTYAELRGALKVISERLDVAGFDLVEINPLLDVPTGATAYLGAHTIIEFLGHICAQPRWVERRNGRA